MKKRYLNCQLQVRAVGDDGTFTGYGSVFGSRNSYGEVVMPGAFRDSLAEKKPRLLWQHDARKPIGTIEAREDDNGLLIEGKLTLEVQQAREAHALMRDGAIDGMSMGFFPVEETVDREDDVIRLNKIDLWEVSLVTFPADDQARVQEVRAALEAGDIPAKRDVEAILRDAGFSRRQAAAFIADGYHGLSNQRDAEDYAGIETAAQRLIAAIRG